MTYTEILCINEDGRGSDFSQCKKQQCIEKKTCTRCSTPLFTPPPTLGKLWICDFFLLYFFASKQKTRTYGGKVTRGDLNSSNERYKYHRLSQNKSRRFL